MKKLNTLLASLIAILLFSGCLLQETIIGNNEITETPYNYADFNTLKISNSFEVKIIQSTTEKIIIKCDENLIEFLDINQYNETVSLGLITGYNYKNTELIAEVYTSDINKITADGACSIIINNFKTENLEFDLSGATKIKANLDIADNLNLESSGASKINLEGVSKNTSFDLSGASKITTENFIVSKSLNIKSSGASKINLNGKAKNASFDLSGASKITAENFIVSKNLSIESSGASNIAITANKDITLDLSGASKCKLYGTGVIIKQNSSGAASVKKYN